MALAVAAMVALGGCWTGQNAAASADLHRTVSTATLRVEQLETQLADGESRIEQLEEVIRAQGKSQASRLENLDEVNAEVTRLRGAIEVMRFELDELTAMLEQQQVDLEKRQLYDEARLGAIERFLDIRPPPRPTDDDVLAAGESGTGDDQPQDPDEQPDMPDSAAKKLEVAAKHIADGKNAVARAILAAAIKEHVGADEMDEIRYRYAETFFNEEEWGRAATSFGKVTDNHPKSDWSCWALLRQGECFDALGQPDNARLFYQGATEGRCARSEAAKEADKKL